MTSKAEHILEISALYELSLSVGSSIHYDENISRFPLSLMEKKELSYVSLWVYGSDEKHSEMNLLYAHPHTYTKNFSSSLDEKLLVQVKESGVLQVLLSDTSLDPIQENLPKHGVLALIPLEEVGILKIYDAQRQELFGEEELAQLVPVLKRFSHSLETCIVHQQLNNKLQEQTHYTTKLWSMIDAALDGFVIINSDGEITEWNPRAEEIFGWARTEVIGQKIGTVLASVNYCEAHHDIIMEFKTHDNERMKKKRIEIITQNKDGQILPVELSLVPVKSGNGFVFCGYIRDITSLKKEEEKQKQLMDKLEVVNYELKDFAHVVSHDLKAPLRAIRNLSDWIYTDNYDKLDKDGQEQFELLRNRVDHMKNLINGILEYSRMGRSNSIEKVVDLNVLLPELLTILDPPAHIELNIIGQMPSLLINEVSINQVFQNLISNAIKYLDKAKGNIEIGCQEEGKNLCFWVKDNGPGIDKENFKRIFKIFETLETQNSYESTGVGLAIVKKILANYNGKIWVESTLGEGSCFYFTLPKKKRIPSLNIPVISEFLPQRSNQETA